MKYFLRRQLPKVRGLRKLLPELLFCQSDFLNHDRIVLDRINKYKLKLWYFIDQDTWRQNFYYQGDFEKAELETIKRLVRKNYVIFDIGANIGFHTVIMSKCASAGNVYAFEPAVSNYRLLAKNITTNNCSNVLIFNQAIGDSEINQELFVFEDYAFNSFINTGRQKLVILENADMTTIDNFISINNIKNLDFMKIDVEGFEYNVIKGARKSIKKFKPQIICELYQPNFNPLGMKIEKIIGELVNLGYQPFVITQNGIKKVKDSLDFEFNYNFYFKPV